MPTCQISKVDVPHFKNDSFIAARVIAFCRSLSNNLPIRIPSCRGFIPQQEGARFYKPSRFQLFSHCLQLRYRSDTRPYGMSNTKAIVIQLHVLWAYFSQILSSSEDLSHAFPVKYTSDTAASHFRSSVTRRIVSVSGGRPSRDRLTPTSVSARRTGVPSRVAAERTFPGR